MLTDILLITEGPAYEQVRPFLIDTPEVDFIVLPGLPERVTDQVAGIITDSRQNFEKLRGGPSIMVLQDQDRGLAVMYSRTKVWEPYCITRVIYEAFLTKVWRERPNLIDRKVDLDETLEIAIIEVEEFPDPELGADMEPLNVELAVPLEVNPL